MRAPFAAHQISVLPKPYNKDSPKGNCRECGGYHGLPAAHLSYVGHAALTDRLLDCDPKWTWEPVAVDADGMPKLDANGGMWIRLTVCGVTRLGYGDAQGKTGPNAVKERIGDALRNAAMRFGAALELWHKGDLHVDDEADEIAPPASSKGPVSQPKATDQKPQQTVPTQAPESTGDAKVVTASQVKLLKAKCSAVSLDEATLCTVFGVATIDAIPASRVNEALDKIKGYASAAAGGQP